jgi:ABC-2 type transport system ATP-binding protein
MSGRQTLDAGTIHFASGHQFSAVSVVPQEIALYGDLTVIQNLIYFGRLCGVPPKSVRERVERALLWAGLQEKRKQLARTLSGGMQRRLNIACSVLHEPRILLLDEPTVGVDPQSRERIYDMVHSLLQSGTSVLLTTHQLDEAQQRCQHLAIIDHGKIVAAGTFDQLVEQTIGEQQLLSVQFSRRTAVVPHPLRLKDDGLEAQCNLNRVSIELPLLLHQLNHARLPVDSLTLRGPTLQSVFLHLTGRELRE